LAVFYGAEVLDELFAYAVALDGRSVLLCGIAGWKKLDARTQKLTATVEC